LASSSKTALPPHIAPEAPQPAKRRWGSSSAICNFQRGISRQRARINVFKIPVTTTSRKESTPPREEQARARGDPRGGCPGTSRRRATASARGNGAREQRWWCFQANMKMGWGNKSDEHYVALTWKGDNSAASLIALVERHGKNPELVITAMMSVAPRHVLITLGLEKGRKYKRPMLVRKWEQKLVEMKFIKGWEKTECTGDKDVLKRTKNNWKALVAYVPLDEVLDVHYKDGNAPVTEGTLRRFEENVSEQHEEVKDALNEKGEDIKKTVKWGTMYTKKHNEVLAVEQAKAMSKDVKQNAEKVIARGDQNTAALRGDMHEMRQQMALQNRVMMHLVGAIGSLPEEVRQQLALGGGQGQLVLAGNSAPPDLELGRSPTVPQTPLPNEREVEPASDGARDSQGNWCSPLGKAKGYATVLPRDLKLELLDAVAVDLSLEEKVSVADAPDLGYASGLMPKSALEEFYVRAEEHIANSGDWKTPKPKDTKRVADSLLPRDRFSPESPESESEAEAPALGDGDGDDDDTIVAEAPPREDVVPATLADRFVAEAPPQGAAPAVSGFDWNELIECAQGRILMQEWAAGFPRGDWEKPRDPKNLDKIEMNTPHYLPMIARKKGIDLADLRHEL
jgi:hypothetical protein